MAVYDWQQIKHVRRQISFLNQHKTNMLITSDRKSGCIAELTDELNILIEQTAALRKKIAENESHLKDTIINLSHDIRTPLTSMDGYFQLLLKSSDSEERQQYASVIADRLSSLKEMLDELFTYAKLTNRAYEVELYPCAVNEILLSVLFSFYKDIKQRGMEPLIAVPEQNILIQGNEPALHRIFQNIIKIVWNTETIIFRFALQPIQIPYRFALKMAIIYRNRWMPVRCLTAFIRQTKQEAKTQQGWGCQSQKSW